MLVVFKYPLPFINVLRYLLGFFCFVFFKDGEGSWEVWLFGFEVLETILTCHRQTMEKYFSFKRLFSHFYKMSINTIVRKIFMSSTSMKNNYFIWVLIHDRTSLLLMADYVSGDCCESILPWVGGAGGPACCGWVTDIASVAYVVIYL